MTTYIIMALVVALLAGLTGGMPSLTRRSGTTEGTDADEDTAGEAPAHSVGRSLPSEILDAVAQGERLSGRPPKLDHVVLVSVRYRLLAEIVDSVMSGAQFIALTGAPGVGKTIMAASIYEELSQQSVRVRWVAGGGGSGIRLPTIICQFLDKAETDVDPADIEWLFDAMTEREDPNERLALIIDDAERLQPDALGYLRLLASVAVERMPQIIFVGDPSFWDIAEQAAGFKDLITSRYELEPLSPMEARAVAERLLAALHRARRPVLDPDALEVVVERSDGLIGRLVALLATIEATATATNQTQVTAAVVDAAAARLEGEAAISLDHGFAPQPELSPAAAMTAPMLAYAVTETETETPPASFPPLTTARRNKSVARLAGAAALFVLIGAAIYSWAPLGVGRIRAEGPTAPEPRDAVESASADTAIVVRLPLSHVALQAQSGMPAADSANSLTVAATEVIDPPVSAVPQIGAAASGAHRFLVRVGTGRTRGALSGYATPPTHGPWPFPPGLNGGG